MRIFGAGEKIGLSQRLAYIAARLSLLFQSLPAMENTDFDLFDPCSFIDFVALKDSQGRESLEGSSHRA
jgi:hypothetical protein